jgi:hypothetical protein
MHIRPDAPPNQLQSTVLDSSAFPRGQVYLAFDTHLFLFPAAFPPLPSFFLMNNTFNMIAIAMLISVVVALVGAEESHTVTLNNL